MTTRAHAIWASVLATASAVGCAADMGFQGRLAQSWATVRVAPAFVSGAVRSVQLASTVDPYTEDSVNHLIVKLFVLKDSAEAQAKDSNGELISQDIAKAHVGGTLVFENLHNDTTYRVRGYAYKAAGTDAENLISVDDKSYVDIAVLQDDRPTVQTLTIQLMDRPFAAQATTSIGLKDGALVNGCGSTIELDPAGLTGPFKVQGC